MRKSKAASVSTVDSYSSTSIPSSSVPASSSSSSSNKNNRSDHSTDSRNTTATINNTKSNTTTTTTTGSSSSSGGDCVINGTRGSSSSNNANSSVQSAVKQQQQRPPLDRQFDVVTAPLATFDTVDLSDEEVTTTKATPTTTTTPTTTNSPSSANNNNTCKQKITTTTIATAATTTAARTSEIKSTHIITNPTSCSNSSNVSAPSPRNSATNNTNSTTITTTPAVTSGKKSDATCTINSSGLTIPTTTKTSKICESSSSSSSGEKNSVQLDQVGATNIAKTKRTEKNSIPVLPNQESINARSLPDGVKDSAVTLKQTRVTDPHATHTSSSDDEGGTSSHVATDLLSVSPNRCKPDSVSVESTRPTSGEGSLALTAAGATAVVGAAAGGATSNIDFANFGSPEDLNSNNIGGSQSTTVDGGGLAAPAATGGGTVSKPKEVSTVEKTSLLDESSSSDSDLSPTEPGPAGGAYTTLKSGSTPNLIRKVSHDATSAIKESSGQTVEFNSPDLIASSSKRKAYERRLQRLQVKTTPINRPRSTTPLSVVTLDEYTNLSSPEISPNLEKLKIVLPADQFGRPIKSPRSKENAFDFNEDRLFRHTKEAIVLQSDGSIGQSPRRILIPPTLSPSQSPCKAAAGSSVSKLVLVSRLPAGTSPLAKSATPSIPPPPPPPSSSTSSSSSFSSSSSTSATPAWKSSEKQWEQFEEFHSKPPQQQPQGTCAIPRRSEHPAALPNFEKKQGLAKTGHPETSSSKGQKEQEKKKKKVLTGEEQTKATAFEQHTDSRRNTTSTLNPSHHKVQLNCPEEEEEILKVEIGSSDVGKAYNIELEVPAKERLDSSHSKSSS